MSKRWIIGIGVAAGVLAILFVGITGLAMIRAWSFMAMNRAAVTMQRPGDFNRAGHPDRQGRYGADFSSRTPQLEVQLLDDDGDGIPDRGVVELPGRGNFDRGFRPDRGFDRGFHPGQGFDRGFAPGQRPGQFSGPRFSPLLVLGCLVNLAVLAGLAVLGVVMFQRRRPSTVMASPSAPVSPLPTNEATEADIAEPEVDDTEEPEAADLTPKVADESPAGDDEAAPDASPEEEEDKA